MSNKTRDLVKIIFTNFFNSLKPRQFRGNYIGQDYFGNKFYEIPPNPSIGKRKSSRWFEPVDKEDFEQEMAAEWEAWLRGRRVDPPTEEELTKNLAIMQLKKRNAKALDNKFSKPKDSAALEQKQTGMGSFPTYNDYETMPGKQRPKEE